MSQTPMHSVSVAGVTLNEEGQVLLIKRRDNCQWQAPGGVLELNETFEEGVVREVLEETGVYVQVDQLTGVYKNLSRGVVALVYRCRPLGGKAKCTNESGETAWKSVEEVSHLVAEPFLVRIADALSSARAAASRAHDGTQLVERLTQINPSVE